MVPLSEALGLVFQDKIHDGKALAGVLWLAEARRRKSL
jgi:hypothetical protein